MYTLFVILLRQEVSDVCAPSPRHGACRVVQILSISACPVVGWPGLQHVPLMCAGAVGPADDRRRVAHGLIKPFNWRQRSLPRRQISST
ncbi:hypothetical protein ACFJGW_17170 [Burkholderiaceae bacterium UC74_6]